MIATLMAAALVVQNPVPAPAPPPALRPGLEPLGFLVGHCWRGDLPTGEPDTHCFEPVYGGQHIRDRHEVDTASGGTYAGETFYSVDGAGGVEFTYYNSLGGVSRGTMRAGDGRLNFGNEEYRGPDGRRITISVFWRPLGDDAYEVVTASADSQEMNGTVVYRRLPPVTVSESRAPDGSHILVHEIEIAAPAADVWTAIATADGWRTWAVPRAWASEPDIIETSYSMTAAPGDPSTIRQRILASIPGRMIAFRTVKAPDGFPNFETFRQTTGLIEIEPIGEGRTHLRLTGAGYPDTEAGRQLLGFFRDGNRVSLEQLRQRFVTGPIDWSRRQATSMRGE